MSMALAHELARPPSPLGAAAVRAVPTATYRLQLHAGFTFRDASELVPYLDELGISYAYTSPYLRARSGSTHGYDVADPNALNPELGSPSRLRAPGDRPRRARHGPAGRRRAQPHGHRRPG